MAIHATRRTRPAVEIARQGKVLLIAESAQESGHLAAMLGVEGHQVRECSSYSEAIDLLADESFDIVLIGQGNRTAEECEVIEWARAADPGLPVVLLVNGEWLPNDYDRVRHEIAGYIAKPVSQAEVAELKETVRRRMRPRIFLMNFESAAR